MIHTDGKPTIACRVVPADSRTAVSVLRRPVAVPTISEDSLLQMERFAGFRAAYARAAADPVVAPALSRITPEEAYSVYDALSRGEEVSR